MKRDGNYVEHCKAMSKARIDMLKDALNKKIISVFNHRCLPQHYLIAITGSDGRWENIVGDSLFEFILLSNTGGEDIPSRIEEIRQKIIYILISFSQQGLPVRSFFEEKDLHTGKLSFYLENRLFFERLIDATPMAGEENLLKFGKRDLQQEIVNQIKSVREKYKNRLREYEKIHKNNGIGVFKGQKNPLRRQRK